MNNLTPQQQDMLRRINLAQIYGWHGLARAMLAEYLLAYPQTK